MTFEEMVAMYHKHSAAQSYILGFTRDSVVYMVELAFSELARYFKADHMSSKRGGYNKIRIRLGKLDKIELVSSGKAIALAAENELKADSHHNVGENYERLVTEHYGKTWEKDSVPFWVAGDITVDGKEIQIKFDGAELTNEKTLARVPALA